MALFPYAIPKCTHCATAEMRDAITNGGTALPKDDPGDVTRSKSATSRRLQAHRARAAWDCGAVPYERTA
jgi:hypothetical protein